MILAVLKHEYDSFVCLYDTWDAFHADTWTPAVDVEMVWDMKAHGKSYAGRKSYIREKAIEYSNVGWSADATMNATSIIGNTFEKYGRRYGLLSEFRENGIC